MADELEDGARFAIYSLTEGNPPIGINWTRPGVQIVFLDAPVNEWKVRRVGKDTYKLSVGGYPSLGVEHEKVAASVWPDNEAEWKTTHQEPQDAYTLALADKPHLGWTIPVDVEDTNVVIAPIISTHSLPPRFLPKQLFLIKKLDE